MVTTFAHTTNTISSCVCPSANRPAVCIFYLILRALDTIEDDMTIPQKKKVPMLKQFYTRLQDPEWKFMGSKEKDKAVLEEFPVVRSIRLTSMCYRVYQFLKRKAKFI